MRWRFSEAEFYTLWMDQAKDELPDPFLFTSATRTADELEAELRVAREGLSRKQVGDFHLLFDAMVNPDLYLTASGWNEQDRFGKNSVTSLRATRKGAKGYVITQLSGETYWHRGGYTVVECDPLRLADAVVDAMPAVESGRRGAIELDADEDGLDREFGRSVVSAPAGTAIARARAFFGTEVTTAGSIEIVQGRSIYGPRGVTRHQVGFRDLTDDGRYVLTENPAQARGVDRAGFVSVLNGYVAEVIRVIKDERGQ